MSFDGARLVAAHKNVPLFFLKFLLLRFFPLLAQTNVTGAAQGDNAGVFGERLLAHPDGNRNGTRRPLALDERGEGNRKKTKKKKNKHSPFGLVGPHAGFHLVPLGSVAALGAT